MGNMKSKKRRFNPVKFKKVKGWSSPAIGLQYKLHHLEVLLGYKEDKDGEFDDSWQAMSPKELLELEAERKRLIEILTPLRLEYNKKRFSKTFHRE